MQIETFHMYNYVCMVVMEHPTMEVRIAANMGETSQRDQLITQQERNNIAIYTEKDHIRMHKRQNYTGDPA